MRRNDILKGLDLPPVVANRTLPLDEQLRIKDDAEVADNVHSLYDNTGVGGISAIAQGINKMLVKRDYFFSLFWSVLAPINNVAIMEITDAYNLLKDTRYFKRDIKRNAKMTMQRIDKYDRAVYLHMKNTEDGDKSQFWLDYTDEHYEAVKKDLKIFYLSVLQVLTKFDEEEREMKARLVTSCALLEFTIGMFDEFFKVIERDEHISIVNMFRDARLDYIFSTWREVVDSICRSNKPYDINDDENANKAFRVIENRLTDMEWLCKVGNVAIAYNPDIVK